MFPISWANLRREELEKLGLPALRQNFIGPRLTALKDMASLPTISERLIRTVPLKPSLISEYCWVQVPKRIGSEPYKTRQVVDFGVVFGF